MSVPAEPGEPAFHPMLLPTFPVRVPLLNHVRAPPGLNWMSNDPPAVAKLIGPPAALKDIVPSHPKVKDDPFVFSTAAKPPDTAISATFPLESAVTLAPTELVTETDP